MICPSYLLNEGQSVNNLSINWAISRCFAFVFVFRVHTATDHQTCVIEYDSPFWRARQGCAERKPAPSSNALLRAHAILPLLFLLAGTCLNGTETAELPVCPWHPGPHKVGPHVTGIDECRIQAQVSVSMAARQHVPRQLDEEIPRGAHARYLGVIQSHLLEADLLPQKLATAEM